MNCTPINKFWMNFLTLFRSNLTHLKAESFNIHREWVQEGCPTSGPCFERKRSSYYLYKAEMRRKKRITAANKNEALGEKLLNKDYVSFWKDWKRASQVSCPPVNRIGDAVTEKEIASTFLRFFHQLYGNAETDAHTKLRQEFTAKFPGYFDAKSDDLISPYFLTWDDIIAISGKLKVGKSYNSFVTAEHLLHGSPKLMVHVHILFNAFIQHSFVPSHFFTWDNHPRCRGLFR